VTPAHVGQLSQHDYAAQQGAGCQQHLISENPRRSRPRLGLTAKAAVRTVRMGTAHGSTFCCWTRRQWPCRHAAENDLDEQVLPAVRRIRALLLRRWAGTPRCRHSPADH